MKGWLLKASRSVKVQQERRLLEQALRAAPAPVPPDGLKERLLAQLPAGVAEKLWYDGPCEPKPNEQTVFLCDHVHGP